MNKVNISEIDDSDHIGFEWGNARWAVMEMMKPNSDKKYSCSDDYINKPIDSMVGNQSKKDYLKGLFKNKGSVNYTAYRFESPELLKHWLKTGKLP